MSCPAWLHQDNLLMTALSILQKPYLEDMGLHQDNLVHSCYINSQKPMWNIWSCCSLMWRWYFCMGTWRRRFTQWLKVFEVPTRHADWYVGLYITQNWEQRMMFIEQIQVHCWLFWVVFSYFLTNLFAVHHLHLLVESSALLVAHLFSTSCLLFSACTEELS